MSELREHLGKVGVEVGPILDMLDYTPTMASLLHAYYMRDKHDNLFNGTNRHAKFATWVAKNRDHLLATCKRIDRTRNRKMVEIRQRKEILLEELAADVEIEERHAQSLKIVNDDIRKLDAQIDALQDQLKRACNLRFAISLDIKEVQMSQTSYRSEIATLDSRYAAVSYGWDTNGFYIGA
jgi:chromosome segregation ATPase